MEYIRSNSELFKYALNISEYFVTVLVIYTFVLRHINYYYVRGYHMVTLVYMGFAFAYLLETVNILNSSNFETYMALLFVVAVQGILTESILYFLIEP